MSPGKTSSLSSSEKRVVSQKQEVKTMFQGLLQELESSLGYNLLQKKNIHST